MKAFAQADLLETAIARYAIPAKNAARDLAKAQKKITYQAMRCVEKQGSTEKNRLVALKKLSPAEQVYLVEEQKLRAARNALRGVKLVAKLNQRMVDFQRDHCYELVESVVWGDLDPGDLDQEAEDPEQFDVREEEAGEDERSLLRFLCAF